MLLGALAEGLNASLSCTVHEKPLPREHPVARGLAQAFVGPLFGLHPCRLNILVHWKLQRSLSSVAMATAESDAAELAIGVPLKLWGDTSIGSTCSSAQY